MTDIDPRIDLRDPPIFLLQAAATWQPVLGDGSSQRLIAGTTGQVLTVNADGSIGWANSSAGFSNPMTTTGDLITSNPGATPVRLGIGATNQVLTVVGGVPTWQNNVGFSNPLTTTGDMLYSNPGSTLVRLGIGATNQVLTVVGGVPTWQNSSSGFANPMTTLGDIITGASLGAPQRLGVGAANQVLTIAGGVPTWANSPAGFANPMTTPGDMIYESSFTIPTRLPIGASGQVLTVSATGFPQWAAGAGGGAVVIFPSGDTSGVTDQANITAAWTSGAVASGGEVWLAPGFFYVKPTSGSICLSPPQDTIVAPQGSNFKGSPVSIRGCGAATVVYPVGAGVTCLYMHRDQSYGGQFGLPAQPMTGYARDFTIDGSLATGASIGLDWGDGWGYHFDLNVVNFTGTNAIGVLQEQRKFWTEKNGPLNFRLSNNTTAMYITTANSGGADHSSEYNTYHITMFAEANQQGVVVDGMNMGGSHMWLQGNMSTSNGSGAAPPGNIAALSIINAVGVVASDAHRWYQGTIHIKVEANPGNGTGTTNPYDYYSDGTGYIRECNGLIASSSLTNGNTNGSEFGFAGLIPQDPTLATAWPSTSFPGLGNPWNNTGPNALVCVSGGTVSGISVGGNATGLTSGAFYVNSGNTLTVNGTVAPTVFNIVPAAQSTL